MNPVSDPDPRLLALFDDPGVLRRFPEPVKLASGLTSDVFVDGKRAVVEPDALALVGREMVAAARTAGARFEAVGGLVLGAVPYTFAVAREAACRWFLVRKEAKGRGTNQLLEGSPLDAGTPVMLVDDVVTTGGSIQEAYRRVTDLGAEVVFAATLLDRGESAGQFFAERGVAYSPLVTYRHLGLNPVVGPGPTEHSPAAGG